MAKCPYIHNYVIENDYCEAREDSVSLHISNIYCTKDEYTNCTFYIKSAKEKTSE